MGHVKKKIRNKHSDFKAQLSWIRTFRQACESGSGFHINFQIDVFFLNMVISRYGLNIKIWRNSESGLFCIFFSPTLQYSINISIIMTFMSKLILIRIRVDFWGSDRDFSPAVVGSGFGFMWEDGSGSGIFLDSRVWIQVKFIRISNPAVRSKYPDEVRASILIVCLFVCLFR